MLHNTSVEDIRIQVIQDVAKGLYSPEVGNQIIATASEAAAQVPTQDQNVTGIGGAVGPIQPFIPPMQDRAPIVRQPVVPPVVGPGGAVGMIQTRPTPTRAIPDMSQEVTTIGGAVGPIGQVVPTPIPTPVAVAKKAPKGLTPSEKRAYDLAVAQGNEGVIANLEGMAERRAVRDSASVAIAEKQPGFDALPPTLQEYVSQSVGGMKARHESQGLAPPSDEYIARVAKDIIDANTNLTSFEGVVGTSTTGLRPDDVTTIGGAVGPIVETPEVTQLTTQQAQDVIAAFVARTGNNPTSRDMITLMPNSSNTVRAAALSEYINTLEGVGELAPGDIGDFQRVPVDRTYTTGEGMNDFEKLSALVEELVAEERRRGAGITPDRITQGIMDALGLENIDDAREWYNYIVEEMSIAKGITGSVEAGLGPVGELDPGEAVPGLGAISPEQAELFRQLSFREQAPADVMRRVGTDVFGPGTTTPIGRRALASAQQRFQRFRPLTTFLDPATEDENAALAAAFGEFARGGYEQPTSADLSSLLNQIRTMAGTDPSVSMMLEERFMNESAQTPYGVISPAINLAAMPMLANVSPSFRTGLGNVFRERARQQFAEDPTRFQTVEQILRNFGGFRPPNTGTFNGDTRGIGIDLSGGGWAGAAA